MPKQLTSSEKVPLTATKSTFTCSMVIAIQPIAVVYEAQHDDVMAEVKQISLRSRQEAAILLEHWSDLLERLDGLHITFLGDSITGDRNNYLNVLRYAHINRTNIVIRYDAVSAKKSVDVFTHFTPVVTNFVPNWIAYNKSDRKNKVMV